MSKWILYAFYSRKFTSRMFRLEVFIHGSDERWASNLANGSKLESFDLDLAIWTYDEIWQSGWWFGTWLLWLSIYWECHHPNWRTHIFQRVGWNHQPAMYYAHIVDYGIPWMFLVVGLWGCTYGGSPKWCAKVAPAACTQIVTMRWHLSRS